MNIEVYQSIAEDFSLEPLEGEAFIQSLANKIAHMLDQQPDLLFSYFYRLDISEKKIRHILQSQEDTRPVNILLAELIVSRQIQRAKTKKEFPSKVDWGDDLM